MENTILVYGLAAGETEDYMEALLAESCKNAQDVERVKDAASKDGWHSFRVTTWDGSAPDFAGVINIGSKSR
jgi:hypothetical protein